MERLALRHVEVYVFRRQAGTRRILLLRRSPDVPLPGIWQPVTGRIRRGENPWAAARREVREETGFDSARWWLLESPTLYFDRPGGFPLALPIFATEVPASASVRMSPEHDAHQFVTLATAAGRVLWDAQREALTKLARQVFRGGPHADALALPVAAHRDGTR